MAVLKVDGTLLKKMVMNGAVNLKNHHKEIDELNVFPVPDGDTGTNMQMTVMSGVREMSNCISSSIVEISKVLSRGALMGARGNSGVILSQFFRGMYVGMKDISSNELDVLDFIKCLTSGYQVAYKAVMTPVEGTILTVVRESAEKINSVKDTISSIDELLDIYVNQAIISLDNTPNLLPVLKEAGVVDSGAAGFIKIVEGMIMALHGKMLDSHVETGDCNEKKITPLEEANIKYGYCTEFILDLKNPEAFNEMDLKTPFSLIGDSLVLVKDENLVKVHVHSNTPGRILELAQKFGEFVTTKIENMRLQHSQLIENKKEQELIKEKKEFALIAVCLGEGISNTFKELGVDYVIEGGQTMNPPTDEFVKAIKEANAKNIIIIPNNGNVIMAAEQACRLVEGVNARVLRAKTIAQGYASLMSFNPNVDIDENISEMENAIKHVKSGEITYSIRNAEINGVTIKENDYMAISDGEITVSTKERIDAVRELLKQKVDDDSAIVTFFYGKDVTEDEVNSLEGYCASLNEDVEVEIIEGKQDIYSYIIAIE